MPFYAWLAPSSRIAFSFRTRSKRELAGPAEVKRPDVKSDKGIVDKFQVQVLWTIC